MSIIKKLADNFTNWKYKNTIYDKPDHNIDAVQNIHSDIALIKKLSKKLDEKEKETQKYLEDLDILVNNVDILIWYVKRPEIQGYVNDAFVDFFNTTKDEVIGKRLDQLMDHKQSLICIENNNYVFENKKKIVTEETVTDGNNQKRILRITRTPKITENGNVDYIVCSAEDMTSEYKARERAEKYFEEINQKNKLLHTIIDCSGRYIWYKDHNHRYIFCNITFKKSFHKLSDEELDSLIGKTDIESISEYKNKTGKRHDFGELCYSTDEHCIKQGHDCYYIEAGYIDNRFVILEIAKIPIYNEDCSLQGTIGFATDKTKQYDKIIKDIKYLQSVNKTEQLSENDYTKSPFVYWIKKE